MAPSADRCLKCSLPFFGRQKIVYCDGGCKTRFHLDCVDHTIDNGTIIFNGGNSAFICVKCSGLRRSHRGDDTPIKSGSAPIIEAEDVQSLEKELLTPPTLPKDLAVAMQLETLILNGEQTVSVLNTLLVKMGNLELEMTELRKENSELKSLILDLVPSPPVMSNESFSEIVQNKRVKNSKNVKNVNTSLSVQQTQEVAKKTDLSSQQKSDSAVLASTSSMNSTESAEVSRKQLTDHNKPNSDLTSTPDNDGFTVVKRKQRKPREVLLGSGDSSDLPIASARPKMKAVFLSRLGPNVQSETVMNYLKKNSNLNLNKTECVKLKTKFSTYSSFHINVLESDLPLFLDTKIWPTGCLIAPFLGRLNKDMCYNGDN